MTQEEKEIVRAQRVERAKKKAAKHLAWAEANERKATEAYASAKAQNDLIPFGQPILVGHHSERGHRAAIGRIDNNMRKSIEFSEKAKYHREKAENIMIYSTRVLGDAAMERQRKREELDKVIGVGSKVLALTYRQIVDVVKVNSKTYTIRFDDGLTCAVDKIFVEPL